MTILEQINRYAGWFTEKARRCSWKRYVIFTKCTIPLDFSIHVPEHSNILGEMHKVLDSHEFPDIAPKLIFDQEEQVVLRTMNDELVLELLIRIIENELAEFEETGLMSGEWRHNPIRYFSNSKKNNQRVHANRPLAMNLH